MKSKPLTGDAAARYLGVMFSASNTGTAVNHGAVVRDARRAQTGNTAALGRLRVAVVSVNRMGPAFALLSPTVARAARAPRARRSHARVGARKTAEPHPGRSL